MQSVVGTIHDGNRSAPVTLARNTPVAKAENDLAFAEAFFLGEGRHFGDRIVRGKTVEFRGIDKYAVLVFGERHGHFFFDEGLAGARLDNDANR